jgi:PAS domain S-box-containing protein
MDNENREGVAEAEQPADIYRLAVEACPSGMVVTDAGGIILMVNRETERMFGHSRETLLGQSVEVLIPTRFRAHHPGFRQGYVHNPGTRLMGEGRDLHGLRSDGSEFAVEIGLNPINTPDGLRIMSVIVDISARKHAEQMFRFAVESSPSALVETDAAGTILLVNKETERLFGYNRQELIGQSVDMLVPPRFRHAHPRLREEYAGNPVSRTMGAGRDLFATRKDGSEFPVEIGLNSVKTDEGLRILSVIVDITERKRAETFLAERAAELQRSNDDLEQFAYIASHDLQEPLRMVASYTELLADRYQGKLDAKADKYIGYAVDGAKRMQRLVNDLLSYSRIGTQGKTPTTTDSMQVMESVLQGMRRMIGEAGGSIKCEQLPTVVVDEIQLGQVFQNLIGNAIKFRSDRPLIVDIRAERQGSHWRFKVEDNGIGIDARYAERIFQMFQRLNERDKYDGSGIGLAIVKRIVERHGGRIWFESEVGKGSTFYFTIPAGFEAH